MHPQCLSSEMFEDRLSVKIEPLVTYLLYRVQLLILNMPQYNNFILYMHTGYI